MDPSGAARAVLTGPPASERSREIRERGLERLVVGPRIQRDVGQGVDVLTAALVCGRARPFVTPDEPWHWELFRTFSDSHYFSMPSGHTTAAFGFAIAVTLAVRPWPSAIRIPVSLAACSSALLVGFARVYTNQHWLSDVIVGLALGSLAALFVMRLHARHPNSRFDQALLGFPISRVL